ncbi:MAG: right-handed parallel beta-helix repeat-containing protein, partial [Phycisphaerae bacterium]|nr:right-handed parallel beta-helix repeat-containing protein [Phycisphaerae bacterium]
TVGNGHSQGIYVGPGVNGVRIEENLIDHNGWRHGVESDRTWYNHNIYLQTGARNVEIRGNIISRAGFYGVKANAGGLIRGNFFIRNSEAVYLESDATVEDNVITESVDHPLQHWGVGINTQKASSAVIRGNLIAHSLSGGNGPKAAISLFHNGATFRGVVEKNVVYNWRIGLWNHSPGEGAGSVIIRENQFQVNDQGTAVYHRTNAPVDRFLYAHNTYAAGERTRVNNIAGTLRLPAEWKQQLGESSAKFARVSYPDATRNLARYQESIGASGDFGAFIAAARAVHRGNFNRSYSAGAINSFFRSGFGMEAAGNFTPVGGGAVGSAPAGSVQPSSQPGTPTSPSAPGGAQLPPAPGIQSFTIDRSSAPHSIYVRFNVNVRPSLSKNDLRVVHLPTGRLVPVRSMTWSAEHNRARFNIRVADLPDGKYRATIHAGSVANTQGVELSGSRSIKFHMLAGDTDGDGRLTFRDGSILVNRFNRSGTFASGDLNLDGQVNLEDFVVLAGRASL